MVFDLDPNDNRRKRITGVSTGPGIDDRPPPGSRVVVVTTPSTDELRDLVSFRRDLEMAKSFIDELIKRGMSNIQSARHPDAALWIAALTTYGRAFKTGVRLSARPSIDSFTEDEMILHQYFLDTRDKHIAHAVNEFEVVIPIAFLTDSAFEQRKVKQVGQAHLEIMPTDANESQALSVMCQKILDDLERRIVQLQNTITRELMAMGPDAVYAFPDAALPDPNQASSTKRRR